MWTSLQYAALASQNITCPGDAAFDPAFAVAVNVTTVPLATVVTLLLPEVTARDVAVAVFVCPAAPAHAPHAIIARTHNAARGLAKVWRHLREVEKT
jgi:hypothetical protein